MLAGSGNREEKRARSSERTLDIVTQQIALIERIAENRLLLSSAARIVGAETIVGLDRQLECANGESICFSGAGCAVCRHGP